MVEDAALSLASITYLDGTTPSEKLAEVLR